jgi:hypothetical protein
MVMVMVTRMRPTTRHVARFALQTLGVFNLRLQRLAGAEFNRVVGRIYMLTKKVLFVGNSPLFLTVHDQQEGFCQFLKLSTRLLIWQPVTIEGELCRKEFERIQERRRSLAWFIIWGNSGL